MSKLISVFMENTVKYSIKLTFQEIKLPPFDEILIIGKNSPHGKFGITKSFELLNPNGFDLIEIEDDKVEAIFVNKRILAKLPGEKLIKILRERVFPFISEGELLKVDFEISISYSLTEEEISQ